MARLFSEEYNMEDKSRIEKAKALAAALAQIEKQFGKGSIMRLQDGEVERDIDVARQIQQALLPRHPPVFEGFDIAGWCQPADETGGDFFDFQDRGDGRLGVAEGAHDRESGIQQVPFQGVAPDRMVVHQQHTCHRSGTANRTVVP